MIDTHPIFFAVTVILLIIIFVIAMMLSNAYNEVTDDDAFSTSAASFPKMNWIMDHFLLVAIVIGLSATLALFAKNQL